MLQSIIGSIVKERTMSDRNELRKRRQRLRGLWIRIMIARWLSRFVILSFS